MSELIEFMNKFNTNGNVFVCMVKPKPCVCVYALLCVTIVFVSMKDKWGEVQTEENMVNASALHQLKAFNYRVA